MCLGGGAMRQGFRFVIPCLLAGGALILPSCSSHRPPAALDFPFKIQDLSRYQGAFTVTERASETCYLNASHWMAWNGVVRYQGHSRLIRDSSPQPPTWCQPQYIRASAIVQIGDPLVLRLFCRIRNGTVTIEDTVPWRSTARAGIQAEATLVHSSLESDAGGREVKVTCRLYQGPPEVGSSRAASGSQQAPDDSSEGCFPTNGAIYVYANVIIWAYSQDDYAEAHAPDHIEIGVEPVRRCE